MLDPGPRSPGDSPPLLGWRGRTWFKACSRGNIRHLWIHSNLNSTQQCYIQVRRSWSYFSWVSVSSSIKWKWQQYKTKWVAWGLRERAYACKALCSASGQSHHSINGSHQIITVTQCIWSIIPCSALPKCLCLEKGLGRAQGRWCASLWGTAWENCSIMGVPPHEPGLKSADKRESQVRVAREAHTPGKPSSPLWPESCPHKKGLNRHTLQLPLPLSFLFHAWLHLSLSLVFRFKRSLTSSPPKEPICLCFRSTWTGW